MLRACRCATRTALQCPVPRTYVRCIRRHTELWDDCPFSAKRVSVSGWVFGLSARNQPCNLLVASSSYDNTHTFRTSFKLLIMWR